MAILLKPEAVTLLAGGYVADGTKVEKLAKQIAALAEAENPAIGPWVKFNVGQYQGVQLHTLSIPIPDDAKDRAKVVSLIGETLEIVVATGQQSVCVAAGRDAMIALKRAIEKSAEEASQTVPPMQVSLALGPIARFIAAVGEEKDRPKAAQIAGILQNQGELDHINLVAGPIPRGVKYRLEIEEGILKLLGRLATAPNSP